MELLFALEGLLKVEGRTWETTLLLNTTHTVLCREPQKKENQVDPGYTQPQLSLALTGCSVFQVSG